MVDFTFLQNPISKKWVILAPRRAKRPDISKGAEPICPFCLGKEKDEKEVYRVSRNVILSETKDPVNKRDSSAVPQNDIGNWLVRVVPNKYPFAPIHEVIIHSPDHHKNFDELPLYQVELIIKTYRQRFITHEKKGQIFIFHNRGEGGGESLPHPHTQIAVVPGTVKMDIARLSVPAPLGLGPAPISLESSQAGLEQQLIVQTPHFYLFCPKTSQWPDEVWVAPKKRGRAFGEISDGEVADLAYALSRLIQIFDLRHGHEFPYNFYIYPGGDWYLRLIPRVKVLGGFELGTGVFVNTQDPVKTISFIKEHFGNPDWERIEKEHKAEYERRV